MINSDMEIEFILDWLSSSGSDCFIGRFINVGHGDTTDRSLLLSVEIRIL